MSKGLEALETLKSIDVAHIYNEKVGAYEIVWASDVYKEQIDTIEKELKALEIIKEKKVNAFALLMSETLESYNNLLYVYPERQLNQAEFDLLKEVLL